MLLGHQVIEHLLRSGSIATSLRALAADIGSSHRMLIYHFGGYDGLLHAVTEEAQRRHLTGCASDPTIDGAECEAVLACWRRMSADDLRPVEMLLLRLSTVLIERGDTDAAIRLNDTWQQPLVDVLSARGRAQADVWELARLTAAAFRGLLLDLGGSVDRRGVDAAAHMFVTSLFGR